MNEKSSTKLKPSIVDIEKLNRMSDLYNTAEADEGKEENSLGSGEDADEAPCSLGPRGWENLHLISNKADLQKKSHKGNSNSFFKQIQHCFNYF